LSLLDTARPIIGYVVAIAIVLLLARMAFMTATSAALTSSATTMSDVLIIVALLDLLRYVLVGAYGYRGSCERCEERIVGPVTLINLCPTGALNPA
jgi:hypothetical protein